LYEFLTYPICAFMSRSSHPPSSDEAYKLWSSSLCSLLQPPATYTL
jgi:hypothetical protein